MQTIKYRVFHTNWFCLYSLQIKLPKICYLYLRYQWISPLLVLSGFRIANCFIPPLVRNNCTSLLVIWYSYFCYLLLLSILSAIWMRLHLPTTSRPLCIYSQSHGNKSPIYSGWGTFKFSATNRQSLLHSPKLSYLTLSFNFYFSHKWFIAVAVWRVIYYTYIISERSNISIVSET
jgi:hypothetical protein